MVIASLSNSGTSATSLVGQVELLILLLIVTLFVALLSRLMRVPYTLLLVIVGFVVGIGVGLFPLIPHEHLDPNLVLYIFIPALLFEGAWNAELDRLEAEWLPIILLVIPGVVLSILVVAVALHVGIGLEWLLALLVGAIVAPTDPVAVIALFEQLGVPDRLRILVEGESIFNDGTGGAAYELVLAVLLPLLGLAEVSGEPSFQNASALLIIAEVLWLIFGGFLLGLGIGWLISHLLRRIDDRLVVITITIAVAYGMYLLGTALSTSGLLAVVGAALVMGSYGRKHAMSPRTIEAADDVWEFIDYLANSLLFLLLGFELALTNLVQSFPGIFFGVLGALIGRVLMIYIFIPLQDVIAHQWTRRTLKRSPRLSRPRPIPSAWRPVMVLSGLRGALSLALVLSLPEALAQRNLLTDIVYGVILVTLLGQGLTLRVLLPHWKDKLVRAEVEVSST
ncbi:MAG TPA: sodium:proton antiporter [Ktedonobacteraceae bacterium]|nr:sodium:proton antiporter [Ktedonobacteraceae bacterium]